MEGCAKRQISPYNIMSGLGGSGSQYLSLTVALGLNSLIEVITGNYINISAKLTPRFYIKEHLVVIPYRRSVSEN